jgi:PLP dependent protein
MTLYGDAFSTETLEQNLRRIRDRIAQAAAKSGRSPDAVAMIAVTKYVGVEQIQTLIDLGVNNIGESRVQEAEEKFKTLLAANSQVGSRYDPYSINWHMIGHLQTNKASKATQIFHTFHSMDSVRIAETLNTELGRTSVSAMPILLHQVLLEVNVQQDHKKHGLEPKIGDIVSLLKLCSEFDRMTVVGLMCMAPHSQNPEATSRRIFRQLRDLLQEANERRAYRLPLTELSMGMTQDYAIAVEEGSTMVRVGTALFQHAKAQ